MIKLAMMITSVTFFASARDRAVDGVISPSVVGGWKKS